MWTLFILTLLGGTITVEARGPFDTDADCQVARLDLTRTHPFSRTTCERRRPEA